MRGRPVCKSRSTVLAPVTSLLADLSQNREKRPGEPIPARLPVVKQTLKCCLLLSSQVKPYFAWEDDRWLFS